MNIIETTLEIVKTIPSIFIKNRKQHEVGDEVFIKEGNRGYWLKIIERNSNYYKCEAIFYKDKKEMILQYKPIYFFKI